MNFGSMGAGIGWEFGHAYDAKTKTWSIWQWEFGISKSCKMCYWKEYECETKGRNKWKKIGNILQNTTEYAPKQKFDRRYKVWFV